MVQRKVSGRLAAIERRKIALAAVEAGLLCRFCFGSLSFDDSASVRDRMCSRCEAKFRAGEMRVTLRGGFLMIGEQELVNLVIENRFRWCHFDPVTGNPPKVTGLIDPLIDGSDVLGSHGASVTDGPGVETSAQPQLGVGEAVGAADGDADVADLKRGLEGVGGDGVGDADRVHGGSFAGGAGEGEPTGEATPPCRCRGCRRHRRARRGGGVR